MYFAGLQHIRQPWCDAKVHLLCSGGGIPSICDTRQSDKVPTAKDLPGHSWCPPPDAHQTTQASCKRFESQLGSKCAKVRKCPCFELWNLPSCLKMLVSASIYLDFSFCDPRFKRMISIRIWIFAEVFLSKWFIFKGIFGTVKQSFKNMSFVLWIT